MALVLRGPARPHRGITADHASIFKGIRLHGARWYHTKWHHVNHPRLDATSGGEQYYTASGASAKSWDKASTATLYAQWTGNTYVVTLPDGTKVDVTYGQKSVNVPSVDFDEGRQVVYDVAEDIREIAAFAELKILPGLFESAHLDSSRTSVVWNDRIDLPSDTIREYGGVV